MTLLLDHCVPRKYLQLLQNWGYSASLLEQHIPADSDDKAVLQLAQQLDAVLLTVDTDFGNILEYPPQNYQGIIVIRYHPDKESENIETLQRALENLYRDELRGALIVIAADRYRIRR